MANTSANHYHRLRLIGKILQPRAFFLTSPAHRRDTVDVGNGVQPPPLPEIRQGIPKDVVIYPNQTKLALQAHPSELLAKIESEKLPANHIAISQNLH